jgi:hypothetical protein
MGNFMKKTIFLATLLLASIASANCVLEKEKDGQRLFTCTAPGTEKSVHVLDLKGDFISTAYYHGYFLRSEIEQGVLKGVLVNAERAFSKLEPKERASIETIKNCVLDNYKYSVSNDFKTGIKNLYRGYRDAGGKISWKDFETANYMVEFSIFTDGMQRQLNLDPSAAKKKIFAQCAPYLIGDAIWGSFKKLAEGLRSIKMGCTGVSSSAASASDGALVHGRNFDTGLLGYYESHQLVIINRQKDGMVSVGIGAAGLHYAGGISGFNNQGLSVSLHQLNTDGTQIRHAKGTSDIAPYLLHYVMMRAKTLDEAIKIIKTRKGFGAWTFFISDAKTDESASIELSGDTVEVARRSKGQFLGQSNHFLGPKTSEEGYEYSLNKTLETRARLAHVTRTLTEDFGKIDYQWVINRLSGHDDELVGLRAFGRTTTKVYTAGTHVMIPARQEWWMSIGETYPTNRSHFVGFRLVKGDIPIEIIGVTKAAELPNKTNWYDSMKSYVQSYLTNETDHDTIEGVDRTLQLLEQAQVKASQDGVYEYTYHFMWARIKTRRAAIAIKQGQRELALADLEDAQKKFQEIQTQSSLTLNDYEHFQIALWQFRTETLKPQALINRDLQSTAQAQAQGLLTGLIEKYPRQQELKELRSSLKQSAQLPIVLDAEIRLGTIE